MSTNLLQDEIWNQRDGTPIRVQDMGLGHLKATVRMLERQAKRIALQANLRDALMLTATALTVLGIDNNGQDILGPPVSLGPSGEMAQDALERDFAFRQDHPVQWLHTLPMLKEMDRRIQEHPDAPNPHAPGSPDWEIWVDKHQHIV